MKQYQAAVIGLGRIGMLYDREEQRPHPSTHVYAYLENERTALACAVDTHRDRGEILRRISPGTRFYASYDEAIRSGALDDVDIISICTPPSEHFGLIRSIVERGFSGVIFCEKPLVSDAEETRMLGRLMADHPLPLLIPNISRRWNRKLKEVGNALTSGEYGSLERIDVRYTRGIYNTGAHLFDLLKMWTGERIRQVSVIGETDTSALPEKSYSFTFELQGGIPGVAQAFDDRRCYLFEIDLYCSAGKIEMRNSGDDVYYYGIQPHHLFEDFREFCLKRHEKGVLNDNCMRNAIRNICACLDGKESPACIIGDAIYPMYVASALEQSDETGRIRMVKDE